MICYSTIHKNAEKSELKLSGKYYILLLFRFMFSKLLHKENNAKKSCQIRHVFLIQLVNDAVKYYSDTKMFHLLLSKTYKQLYAKIHVLKKKCSKAQSHIGLK